MGFVIAIAQQKGGAGKSTLAAHLGAALAAGRRVALVDADPQATLSHWVALRARHGGIAPVALEAPSGWRVPATLDRLRRSHEVVLLDTPPHAETDNRVALRAADLVLVPLQPSGPDLWASETTLRLAEAEGRPARVVLNRVPARGRLKQVVLAELASRGIAPLGPGLGNRSAFATAFMLGLGVTEADPESLAAQELAATLSALEQIMKN
ncbi:MAG: ParA family partition ATPase [Rhodovarius sp.]|nr:ParA family protein [Rhodovarius sp.]MDW8313906.1 ParA family partition ATPase [Rhodovarius sp.]